MEQRVEWGPAPGEVGSWITDAPEEAEVRRGHALVQGWRLAGMRLLLCVVPVLHRAAGTGEGTIVVSTSRISHSPAVERSQGSTGSIA